MALLLDWFATGFFSTFDLLDLSVLLLLKAGDSCLVAPLVCLGSTTRGALG